MDKDYDMIRTKKDLHFYLQEDKKRNVGSMNKIKYCLSYILQTTDGIMAYRYLRSLRKYEYAINNLSKSGICGKILKAYYSFIHHRYSMKYNVSIGPNMVGYGFRMPHLIGGGIVINCESMGNYCQANVNVLIGHKDKKRPIIGDNVTMETGCKIYGGIVVGSNVIVAPNAVVTKDVKNNCIVGGIPAKIIKEFNNEPNK